MLVKASACPAVTKSPTETVETSARPAIGLVIVVHDSSVSAYSTAALVASSVAFASARLARAASTSASV